MLLPPRDGQGLVGLTQLCSPTLTPSHDPAEGTGTVPPGRPHLSCVCG